MKRKEFIRLTGSAILLLANGRISAANPFDLSRDRASDTEFRFAVASDGHYGEKNTDYEKYFSSLVSSVNKHHQREPFRFIMINGDIVHDDKNHYPAAKQALEKFECRYYVSQGNHDKVSAAEWNSIWGMPVNYDFVHGKYAFLTGTTSDEKGTYLCPDLGWFTNKLEEHKDKQVYIFIHINPGSLTDNAVECNDLFDLFGKYPNIKAVFNGHDHDLDDIRIKNNIPFLFDAHFGGSWGTSYRGYRVVEILKDGSALTYIMNPVSMIRKDSIK